METETRAELAKLGELVEEIARVQRESRGHLEVLAAEVQALRLLAEGLLDGLRGRDAVNADLMPGTV